MATDTRYWVWLGSSLGYGSPAILPLLERFGDAEGVYNASAEEIAEISSVCAAERKRLSDHDLTRADEVAGYCMHGGVRILHMADPEYPTSLLKIANPPAVLYCRGTLPDWNRAPCIAVVGARAMSYYGACAAAEISYDLGRMGCVTVSGMALGIDGVSAAATIEAGGKAVAVLGSGIDRLYPREHKTLYQAILKGGGAIVTEFPPYEGADAFHFPLRNRIISALSLALILVEGEANSGALITAKYAKKQGKTVFAVPGKINDKNSEAPHLLLKQEAKVLTCADDIYDNFKENYFSAMNPFALLPNAGINVEAVMRKYGIAVGKEKPREKRLLAKSTDASSKRDVFQRIKSLFSPENEREDTLASPQPSIPSQQETESRRKTLDEERKRGLSAKSYAVYSALDYEVARHPDELVLADMGADTISAELITLEVLGYVTFMPGGCYLKNENT